MPRGRIKHSTQDDEGNAVPLWSPWGAQRDALPEGMRERLIGGLDASHTEPQQYLWGFGIAIAALVISLGIVPQFRLDPFLESLVIFAVPVLLVVAYFRIQRWVALDRSGHNLRSTMLALRCCASCGYSLKGVPAQEGLTTCPECRASWRLPEAAEEPLGDNPVWKWSAFDRALIGLGLRFLIGRRAHGGVDDRGRTVEIVYPIPGRRPPTHWHTIPREQQTTIARELRGLNTGTNAVFVLVTLFMLLQIPRRIREIGAGTADEITFVGIAAPFVMLALIVIRIRFPIIFKKEKISKVMLAHARCGSCAGDLAGVPSADDGCTVCPCCRAAWRVPADAGERQDP